MKGISEYAYEHHSIDGASSRTSIEGLGSDPFGDGDLTSSPVDTQCEDHSLGEDAASNSDESSALGWPLCRKDAIQLTLSPATPDSSSNKSTLMWGQKTHKRETEVSEVELMKERFAKLLLGEDMSGGGKGVCTALAISNAITNLSASVFGELWRLEPLSPERRTMWRREMDWLLSVSDYIVEFVPSSQNFPDGSNMEVMISRPRSDLYINLPALRKLDTMLLESLDSFKDTEFWYVDQGIAVSDREQQATGEINNQRQDDKWWLPTPKVPINGLSDGSRKWLQFQRECTSQILKAAMSINGQVLSEMEVPDVYWEALPKNAKSCLGDLLYRGLTSENFSADSLLSQLDLSTEHNSMEVANRIESAIHLCRKKKIEPKQILSHKDGISTIKSSWGKMRDLVGDVEKKVLVAERAESLLLSLRQKAPGLPQSVLDVNKIQFNRDVGQSILESYSRVLESLAFNIISRIDDVMHADKLVKHDPRPTTSLSRRRAAARFRKGSLPFSVHLSISTPYATPFTSPCFSPGPAPRLEKNLAPFTDAKLRVATRHTVGRSSTECRSIEQNMDSNYKNQPAEDTGSETFKEL
ncbi:hypothetical protein O6H91_23G070000 [Diphasiastrum complanatum]|uniref:Uncharacterized protein n=1 Tax=Diphasiastrum complanatum TaxID=34168 RepID=A0ACC2AD93_DIPCM|nr:hypothetical protein O6H91_23G070000 [Diphasiastrum complanatum]